MSMKPVQQSAQATALGGAVTTTLFWAARTYGHVEIPPDVQAAITVGVMAIITHFVDDAVPPTTPEKKPDA
jgi:hypothetical protein